MEYIESLSHNSSAYVRDEFTDEIALGINTEKGLVVIVGCSHIGIVNIITTIIKRIGMPIYAVIGEHIWLTLMSSEFNKRFPPLKQRIFVI